MESVFEAQRIGTGLDPEILSLLKNCRMSARGFFYEILPVLESAQHYGRIPYNGEEMAELFGVSRQKIHIYVSDLKQHRILKVTSEGELYCPILWKRLLRTVKKP